MGLIDKTFGHTFYLIGMDVRQIYSLCRIKWIGHCHKSGWYKPNSRSKSGFKIEKNYSQTVGMHLSSFEPSVFGGSLVVKIEENRNHDYNQWHDYGGCAYYFHDVRS